MHTKKTTFYVVRIRLETYLNTKTLCNNSMSSKLHIFMLRRHSQQHSSQFSAMIVLWGVGGGYNDSLSWCSVPLDPIAGTLSLATTLQTYQCSIILRPASYHPSEQRLLLLRLYRVSGGHKRLRQVTRDLIMYYNILTESKSSTGEHDLYLEGVAQSFQWLSDHAADNNQKERE